MVEYGGGVHGNSRSGIEDLLVSLRNLADNYRAWAAENRGGRGAEYAQEAVITDKTIADLERLVKDQAAT